MPALELSQISNNRFGVVEFSTVSADGINAQRMFIDVQVQTTNANQADKLNLGCDGRLFDYQAYGDRVLPETLRYIQQRRSGDGRRPMFVTDVDVPLRLFNVEQRDQIQTLHFLKYIKNFENKLNQMLNV